SVGVLSTFAYLGVAYLIVTIIAGMFMQNPPEGWQLEGWKPSALQTSQRAGHDYVLGEALKTWQWWALWMLLFLNTCAGIAVISQEAPIFQELTKVSAVVAGSMVGIASLGNAVGRVFWAWVSDLITRRFTFLVMFIVHRPYAGNDRFLCRRVARHRCGDGNFNSAAGFSAATTGFRCGWRRAGKEIRLSTHSDHLVCVRQRTTDLPRIEIVKMFSQVARKDLTD